MMAASVRVEPEMPALEDFFHHSLLLQPVERVVDGRPRSHREFAIDGLQNLIRRRVMMRRLQLNILG